MSEQEEVLSPRAAYAIGIAERRSTVMMLGLCGAVGLIVGTWSLINEPHFNWLDAGILSAMTVAYVILTCLLMVFPKRSLHGVLLGWVLTASIGIGALVVSSYFGENGNYILDNDIPWFIGWTPAVIIFAFTYLPITVAQIISISFCVVTTLTGIVFIYLHYPLSEGESFVAAIYMLMQFAMLNPMCVFLLSLQLRLHEQVIGLVRDSYAKAESAKVQAENAQRIDMVTGALNRTGIDAQLQMDIDAMDSHQEILVVAAAIDDFQDLVDEIGDPDSDAVLCEMSQLLKGALGPGTRLGRRESSHFILWSLPHPVGELDHMAKQLFLKLKEHHFNSTGSAPDINMGSTCAKPSLKAHNILEQVNFNLFLARTRDTGILHS